MNTYVDKYIYYHVLVFFITLPFAVFFLFLEKKRGYETNYLHMICYLICFDALISMFFPGWGGPTLGRLRYKNKFTGDALGNQFTQFCVLLVCAFLISLALSAFCHFLEKRGYERNYLHYICYTICGASGFIIFSIVLVGSLTKYLWYLLNI
jgi:predicted PurR-regulated permease PerM